MPYIETVDERVNGMLRRTIAEETTYPSLYVPVPRKDEMSEAHVEDYLDHFCAPLVGKISYEERVKMRDELRTQVESVIAAHLELGSTREQAIALALQQFSHVPSVAQVAPPVQQQAVHSATAYQQEAAVSKSASGGALLAFGAFGLAGFLQLITISSLEHTGPIDGLFVLMVMAAYPALAGLTLGYRKPDRPLRSLLRAQSWLALPALFSTWIAMDSSGGVGGRALLIAAILLAGNTAIGGLGAKVGTWMRKSGVLDRLDPPYPARIDNGPHRMP
jgi:hypothetical protein